MRWILENVLALWAVGVLAVASVKIAAFIERQAFGPPRAPYARGLLEVVAWPYATFITAVALLHEIVLELPRRWRKRAAHAEHTGEDEPEEPRPTDGAEPAATSEPKDPKKPGPIPGKKVPAPRKLVVGEITVCEEGELLTPEEFGERFGRALRKSAGITDEQILRARSFRLHDPLLEAEKAAARERLRRKK